MKIKRLLKFAVPALSFLSSIQAKAYFFSCHCEYKNTVNNAKLSYSVTCPGSIYTYPMPEAEDYGCGQNLKYNQFSDMTGFRINCTYFSIYGDQVNFNPGATDWIAVSGSTWVRNGCQLSNS